MCGCGLADLGFSFYTEREQLGKCCYTNHGKLTSFRFAQSGLASIVGSVSIPSADDESFHHFTASACLFVEQIGNPITSLSHSSQIPDTNISN
jgi:hypothetical protein